MKDWVDIVPPPAGIFVWNAFVDLLHSRRAKRGPLIWTEVQAYLALTETPLSPLELNSLREMDRAFLEALPPD